MRISLNQKLLIISLFIGIFLGGVGGYLLSPKPNTSKYLSEITMLQSNVTDLEIIIANLQQEIAQNKAEIADYQLQITELDLQIIELKGRILELRSESFSDWEYQQLQNAYFELKRQYEDLSQAKNWVIEAYYDSMEELDWSLLHAFEGEADVNGVLNVSLSEFLLSKPYIKMVFSYRGDLYESISLQIYSNGKSFSPADNYLTLSTGKDAKRLTYTQIKSGGIYHLVLKGCYSEGAKEDLARGLIDIEYDYVVEIYAAE